MNKEFVKKMMKAKMLEYEAIKELIPSNMKDKVESCEKELIGTFKDIALEMIIEEKDSCSNKSDDIKRKAKKICVEFN